MNEIILKNTMTSLELVELINRIRTDFEEKTELRHDTFLNTIRDEFEEEISLQEILESEYKNSRGKVYPMFILTHNQAKQVLVRESKYVRKAVIKYIEKLEKHIQEQCKRDNERDIKWQIEREKGKLVRHILTDTIKMKVADSPNKKFMYPNYTKLIYKILFGKSFSELKEIYKIKPKESLRDYISSEELKELEQMEMLISSLINLGWGYDEIKEFVIQNQIKKLAS